MTTVPPDIRTCTSGLAPTRVRPPALISGVHHIRPVGAPLARQEPAEQGQRVGPAKARDLAREGAPDDEVGALAPADLVVDDPAHGARVFLVADVEAAAFDPDLVRGQRGEHVRERQFVALVRDQHHKGGLVVAYVEAALPDLAERHQGERGPLPAGRSARRSASWTGPISTSTVSWSRPGVRLRSSANGGQSSSNSLWMSMRWRLPSGGEREERPGKTVKAAPRGGLRASVVRAGISGPPDERSTTSYGSSARTCRAPYQTPPSGRG